MASQWRSFAGGFVGDGNHLRLEDFKSDEHDAGITSGSGWHPNLADKAKKRIRLQDKISDELKQRKMQELNTRINQFHRKQQRMQKREKIKTQDMVAYWERKKEADRLERFAIAERRRLKMQKMRMQIDRRQQIESYQQAQIPPKPKYMAPTPRLKKQNIYNPKHAQLRKLAGSDTSIKTTLAALSVRPPAVKNANDKIKNKLIGDAVDNICIKHQDDDDGGMGTFLTAVPGGNEGKKGGQSGDPGDRTGNVGTGTGNLPFHLRKQIEHKKRVIVKKELDIDLPAVVTPGVLRELFPGLERTSEGKAIKNREQEESEKEGDDSDPGNGNGSSSKIDITAKYGVQAAAMKRAQQLGQTHIMDPTGSLSIGGMKSDRFAGAGVLDQNIGLTANGMIGSMSLGGSFGNFGDNSMALVPAGGSGGNTGGGAGGDGSVTIDSNSVSINIPGMGGKDGTDSRSGSKDGNQGQGGQLAVSLTVQDNSNSASVGNDSKSGHTHSHSHSRDNDVMNAYNDVTLLPKTGPVESTMPIKPYLREKQQEILNFELENLYHYRAGAKEQMNRIRDATELKYGDEQGRAKEKGKPSIAKMMMRLKAIVNIANNRRKEGQYSFLKDTLPQGLLPPGG